MKRSILLALILGIAGCWGGGLKEAEEALKEKGVVDVLKDAADDEYDPPADGKLSDSQMKMYLEVKKRESELLAAAKENFQEQADKAEAADQEGASLTAALEGLRTLRSAGDLLTLDIRAAQELGHNTAEYQWVKGQVLEATVSTYTDNLRASAAKAFEQSLEQLKKARQSAKDESTRKVYDQQIKRVEEAMEESREQARSEQSEALRHNQELISKYGDQIKLLEEEIAKYKALDRK